MPLRMTTEGLKLVATGATANGDANVDTALFGCWFGLFTSWPGWGPGLTLADLQLATFGGYAGKAATWSATYVGSNGWPSSVSNLTNWTPANDDEPNAILGVCVTSLNDDGVLLGIYAFDAPLAMESPDNRLNFALEFGVDPGATYGDGYIIA